MGGRDKLEKDVEAGQVAEVGVVVGSTEENTVRKSESNNTLSSRNLELHDSEVTPDTSPGLDLDQTTMIGSALDLDSLDGDKQSEVGLGGQVSHNTNSQSGSQIGLLKLSAVWQSAQRPSKKNSMLRKGAGHGIKVLKISNPCDEVWHEFLGFKLHSPKSYNKIVDFVITRTKNCLNFKCFAPTIVKFSTCTRLDTFNVGISYDHWEKLQQQNCKSWNFVVSKLFCSNIPALY